MSGTSDNDKAQLATAAAAPPLDSAGRIGSTDAIGGGNSDAAQQLPRLPDDSNDGAHTRCTPGQRTLLSDPLDEMHLSSLLRHARAQIGFFPASAEDVVARNKKGGSKHPLTLGRVGIRCRWCAHLPHKERANGAVAYPNSIRLVHQAVRNWQRHHLPFCPNIPQAVKDETKSLGRTRQHSSDKSIRYWVESLGRKGLYNTEKEGDGIRLQGVDYSNVDNCAVPTDDGSNNATKKPAKRKRASKPNAKKKIMVAGAGAEVEAAQDIKAGIRAIAGLPDVALGPTHGATDVAGGVKLDANAVGALGGEIESRSAAFSRRPSSLDALEADEGEALAGIILLRNAR